MISFDDDNTFHWTKREKIIFRKRCFVNHLRCQRWSFFCLLIFLTFVSKFDYKIHGFKRWNEFNKLWNLQEEMNRLVSVFMKRQMDTSVSDKYFIHFQFILTAIHWNSGKWIDKRRTENSQLQMSQIGDCVFNIVIYFNKWQIT